MEGQAEGSGYARREPHGSVRDTSNAAAGAVVGPGPRIYEKFAGDHPADKQSFRSQAGGFVETGSTGDMKYTDQLARGPAPEPHVRYHAIPVAPVMTPEQLVFWLRGMADTGLLHIPDATTTLGVIFDAAQRAFTASPEPARTPCGCGGHR